MTPYRVRLHPLVAYDLDVIIDLLERAGPTAVARKLDEIEAVIARLAELPHWGTRRDAILPGLRAVPAARRGVVAFTVDDAVREVLVIAVTYGGADWMGRVGMRRG